MKVQRTEIRSARRWGRLGADAPCPFRRGAWYPVLSLGQDEVVIEVRRKPVIVPRRCLDLVAARPSTTWTVIPRVWGGPYLVCPNCAERVWWRGVFGELRCLRCDGLFLVDAERPRAALPATRGIGGD
ncbi:MAG TPA: hypothetical protein VEO58_06085 [Gemmatimonadales bacterium]|nr:hypothetical protein [Gemmatimonadales bacterium]